MGGGQSARLGCVARGLTHTVSPTVLMSALGQKRTWRGEFAMSALPRKRTSRLRRIGVLGPAAWAVFAARLIACWELGWRALCRMYARHGLRSQEAEMRVLFQVVLKMQPATRTMYPRTPIHEAYGSTPGTCANRTMIARITKATESQKVHFDGVCKSITLPPWAMASFTLLSDFTSCTF